MTEREEARIIAAAMRCSISFEDSLTAVLAWSEAREVWRVVRRGAGWRSLLDLSERMIAERTRESVGDGNA
jgi:hypothetical protein